MFKAMTEATGGVLTAIRGEAAPGEGPPLHVHPDQDELIHTLGGLYLIQLGDAQFEAPPGSFVFISRGTPHTWRNVGATPARFFAATIPASPEFEQCFVCYAELPAHEPGSVAALPDMMDHVIGVRRFDCSAPRSAPRCGRRAVVRRP